MQRVPKKPPLSSINRSVPILSHSLSYAVKARFTMARANQSRERERERGGQLTWFDPFCKSTLPATKNSKPGPRRNVIVPLTRNRGISLRSPSIVVTLLVTCRCSCTTSTLLYPPSPLGCGLVYNWRICKHIRATDSAS